MLIVNRARKPAVMLTAQLALIAICLWAFGRIADAALDPADLAELDLPVTTWFAGLRTDQINTAMLVLTWLGSGWITIPLLIVASILLPAPENRLRHIGIVTTIIVGVTILVQNIKFLTARPRPDLLEAVVTSNGFAFPSGHTAQAVAAYGALAWLVSQRFPRLRAHAWSAAAVTAAVVGLSRIYLGVHWLTDVLGGLTLALGWLTAVLVAANAIRFMSRRRKLRQRASGHTSAKNQ